MRRGAGVSTTEHVEPPPDSLLDMEVVITYCPASPPLAPCGRLVLALQCSTQPSHQISSCGEAAWWNAMQAGADDVAKGLTDGEDPDVGELPPGVVPFEIEAEEINAAVSEESLVRIWHYGSCGA